MGAFVASGAVAALTIAAPGAHALTINPIGTGGEVGGVPAQQTIYQALLGQGDAVHMNWRFNLGGGGRLHALGFLMVEELTATTARVFVRVDNFSTPGDSSNINLITSFGLGVGNDVTLNTAASTPGTFLTGFNTSNNLTGSLPGTGSGGSVQDIICATSGSSCTGGASGGIPTGRLFDQFTFVLDGTFGDTIALDTFGLRFQSVDDGSLSAALPGRVTPVPTPALLPGLVGLGVAALRKRQNGNAESVEM